MEVKEILDVDSSEFQQSLQIYSSSFPPVETKPIDRIKNMLRDDENYHLYVAINKNKVGTDKVIFIQTDLFNWRPDTQYDIVFFSFWLSHVPAQKFESFWNTVRLALKPHGRVFFIDSFKSKKNNKTPPFNNQNVVTSTRTLNNGKKFNIIKIMYDPKELEKRLERLGWRISIKHTHNHFLYGYGESA